MQTIYLPCRENTKLHILTVTTTIILGLNFGLFELWGDNAIYCQTVLFHVQMRRSQAFVLDMFWPLILDNASYLMVSSVVGFYSSPLFSSLLPRAEDTNLTQVQTLDTLIRVQKCSHVLFLFLFLFFFINVLTCSHTLDLCVSLQIIGNCVSLLVLSSALPVFSRTLGKLCCDKTVVSCVFVRWKHDCFKTRGFCQVMLLVMWCSQECVLTNSINSLLLFI